MECRVASSAEAFGLDPLALCRTTSIDRATLDDPYGRDTLPNADDTLARVRDFIARALAAGNVALERCAAFTR